MFNANRLVVSKILKTLTVFFENILRWPVIRSDSRSMSGGVHMKTLLIEIGFQRNFL